MAFGVTAPVAATVIYDENISGDVTSALPGVSLGTLALGTSTVVGNLPGGFDDDWFEFTIGAGMQLDDILIAAFTGNDGNVSFVGGAFNTGPFDAGQIGTDVLDLTGPTSTLAPGTYSVKAGTGTNVNTYALDFVVSSTGQVPEPASLALLSLGLLGLGWSGRNKT